MESAILRDLLARYVQHIIEREGIDYIPESVDDWTGSSVSFTKTEIEELKRASGRAREVIAERKRQ